MSNPFINTLQGIQTSDAQLTVSEFAARYFLNPIVPKGIKDDPDGSYHARLQILDKHGDPFPIKQNQLLPLEPRWYQREVLDKTDKYTVVRFGRRTGKTFMLGVQAAVALLRDPTAKILLLAPNESHVKLLFDDYIRPLLTTYRHKSSSMVGIPSSPNGNVPAEADFVIAKDTQKPQEIVITDGEHHNSRIKGMVISDSARGQSASLVIFDEADYADTEKVQKIVSPIIMTMPDTRIVMSSTPTGRRDSFFYKACHDQMWSEYHCTFKVLPHYSEELHRQAARMTGGENTNAFKQEYLAEFGARTEGVFSAKALQKSFIVSPYAQIMEQADTRTGDRNAKLAGTESKDNYIANYEGVRPLSFNVTPHGLGSTSIYRPEYQGKGIITVGTDWNELAGMQTCIIWWPPKNWLRQGKLRVSRFRYEGDDPITTDRAKTAAGMPREFVVGQDNGMPDGTHDLSQVKGIVIWHGRLESGQFNWAAAANRVLSMMSIPNFINAWYVDHGYGEQVNQMILESIGSGHYHSDGGNLLSKPEPIPEQLMTHIRRFHPDLDHSDGNYLYKTVQFGTPYKHRDFDFTVRGDRYKDVMIALAKRMVTAGNLLMPYGQLIGYLEDHDLGTTSSGDVDLQTGMAGQVDITDRDDIDYNGAEPSRGEYNFGGLITQMQQFRVVDYTKNGKPKYQGPDHAIDALMLAILAYWENYSHAGAGNIFNPEDVAETRVADQLFKAAQDATHSTAESPKGKRSKVGNMHTKQYTSESAPLKAMRQGKLKPEEAGTSMMDMLRSAYGG